MHSCFFAILLLCLLPVSCGPSRPAGEQLRLGDNFPDPTSLNQALGRLGYSQVGRFGETWPGQVIEIDSGLNELSFTRHPGPRHTYQGFTGYNLVMVRLAGAGGVETIMVFRSDRYRDKPDPAIPVGRLDGGFQLPGRIVVPFFTLAVLALVIGLTVWLFRHRRVRQSFPGNLKHLRRVLEAARSSKRKGAYVVIELPGGESLRLAPLPRGFWLNLTPGAGRPLDFAERLSKWVTGRGLRFLAKESGSGIGEDLELPGSAKLLAGVIADLLTEVYALDAEQELQFSLINC